MFARVLVSGELLFLVSGEFRERPSKRKSTLLEESGNSLGPPETDEVQQDGLDETVSLFIVLKSGGESNSNETEMIFPRTINRGQTEHK